MKKTKEIGYELGNVYWYNLPGFQKLWNQTDTDTKDKIVNEIGELAVKLVNITTEISPVISCPFCNSENIESSMFIDEYDCMVCNKSFKPGASNNI